VKDHKDLLWAICGAVLLIILGTATGGGSGPNLAGIVVIVGLPLLLCGALARALGVPKGFDARTSFWIGFWFGPLGILFVLLTRPTPKVEAQRQLAIEEAKRQELEREGSG
jgi:hypothetical protein